MTQDEITVKLGVDTSAVATGLRTVGEHVQGWAHEQVAAIKGVFGGIAAAFSVEKGIEFVRGLPELGKQLRETAEMAGTSAEFIQGLNSAANQLGVSSEKAGAGLNFLSRKIGEARKGNEEAIKTFEKWHIDFAGKSNEEVFYDIADAIKTIPDPAQRAAAAFELMGKASKEMVGFLAEGGDEIKKLVDASNKLSETDVVKLAIMEGKIKELERSIKSTAAGLVVSGLNISSPNFGLSEDAIKKRIGEIRDAANAGEPSSGLQTNAVEENEFRDMAVAQLLRERERSEKLALKAQDEKAASDRDSAEQQRMIAESDKQTAEDDKKLDEEWNRMVREAMEAKRKEKETADETARLNKENAHIQRHIQDLQIQQQAQGASYPTIEELANFRGVNPRFRYAAQQYILAKRDEVASRAMFGGGEGSRADFDKEYAKRAKMFLEEAGVISPELILDSINDSMKDAKDSLAELNRKAAEDGIKIIPITGQ